LLLAFAKLASSQENQCNKIIFNNNFSSTSGWTTVSSSGTAYISGGVFNLVNSYCAQYNKAYYNLGTTVSNTYFKARCKYTITTTNPSGNGVGTLIMGLTAGTLDYGTYDASGSYAPTNQDAIAAVINSPSVTDNNINDWEFYLSGKKGTGGVSATGIFTSSSISTYYVQIERTAKGMAKLTVCSDSSLTLNLPGSPITLVIDSTIQGLNTVQHGTTTGGSASRMSNATIDNDYVCDNSAPVPPVTCNETIFTNNFSSSSGWTTVSSSGTAYISGGVFNLVNSYCAQYNKTYYSLGLSVSNTYFKAKCKYTITTTNPSGNGVGMLIMGLTAGILDYGTYDASGSYAPTNQDAIAAVINSPTVTDNNINDWEFYLSGKKGTGGVSATGIFASSSISTYYVQIERTKSDSAQLSVFTDSSFTIHLVGSPISLAIDSTITGLNTVQHGTTTGGSGSRMSNATIDNDYICDYNPNSQQGIKNLEQDISVNVYPNPSNGAISIDFGSAINEDLIISITNTLGQVVYSKIITNGSQIVQVNLPESSVNGIYTLMLRGNSGTKVQKVLIEK